ncbi:HNH endonuclease [Arthrobacter sp. USHLN218]|uniref:HNH endonuclease n=1 Tax=Arthrobacter sp. USHLN218 TaxID=3081232 RepID=UPI003015FAA1
MQDRTCTIADCDTPIGKRGARGYCPKHYRRFRVWGDPNALKRTQPGATPFEILKHNGWSEPSGGCWEYSGSRDKGGYGVLKSSGKMYQAHRVAYQELVAEIPEGLLLRHTCDNPPCINPKHLIPGTQKDNMQDALKRKRIVNGERSANHKLKDSEVAQMRALHTTGRFTQAALAEKFKCSRTQVSNILSGKRRANVTFPGI